MLRKWRSEFFFDKKKKKKKTITIEGMVGGLRIEHVWS